MPHPTKQLDFWHGWADINPKRCPCRGFGWLMSDWSSYHVCGYHGKGVPHPEDREAGFDSESHLLKVLREAWVRFRDLSGQPRWYFRAQCEAILETQQPQPQDWVDAAEEVFWKFSPEATVLGEP